MRLFIPDSENLQYNIINSKISASVSEQKKNLWATLENYMQKENAWHNPNLSIYMLANAIGTTKAEIEKLLELMGYSEFDDYVAYLRIREFCNIVNNGDIITIEDTFFRVGFRYRDIASKQFIRIMHQSPEEYIRKREGRLLTNK